MKSKKENKMADASQKASATEVTRDTTLQTIFNFLGLNKVNFSNIPNAYKNTLSLGVDVDGKLKLKDENSTIIVVGGSEQTDSQIPVYASTDDIPTPPADKHSIGIASIQSDINIGPWYLGSIIDYQYINNLGWGLPTGVDIWTCIQDGGDESFTFNTDPLQGVILRSKDTNQTVCPLCILRQEEGDPYYNFIEGDGIVDFLGSEFANIWKIIEVNPGVKDMYLIWTNLLHSQAVPSAKWGGWSLFIPDLTGVGEVDTPIIADYLTALPETGNAAQLVNNLFVKINQETSLSIWTKDENDTLYQIPLI